MNYSDMIEKAKYISRKKVKGKYVYKYAETPRSDHESRTRLPHGGPPISYEITDEFGIKTNPSGRGEKDKKKMMAEMKAKMKNMTDRELQSSRFHDKDPTTRKMAEAMYQSREPERKAKMDAAYKEVKEKREKRENELAEREKKGEVLMPQRAAFNFATEVEELAKLLSGNPVAQKKLIEAKQDFVNSVMYARGMAEPDGGYFGDR